MGHKLLWAGLTTLIALPNLVYLPYAEILGSIVMVVGLILALLDK